MVSMVVPAYNVERYIERCVTSLLGQSHKRLEVIVVNDRSTDGTAAILDRMALQDQRLKVLHSSVNGGPHAARAMGVVAACGACIGFADGDDRVLPDMVAKMLEAMQRTQADIVVCGVQQEDPEGKDLGPKVRFLEDQVVDDDPLGRFSRLEFGSGVLWNKLFRREVIVPYAALPLPRSVDAGEDHIVCVGCFAAASRVVLLPDPLYLYLVRETSLSNDRQKGYGFAFLLNCYVTCLEAYANAGDRVLSAIDTLYRLQFRFDGYEVDRLEDLEPQAVRLREALQRLATVRPQAAHVLVHAFDQRNEPSPSLPLRYHLGQLRIILGKIVQALLHGRS
jgi:glycosyltransferase involved in cell wall biosynthesis